MNEVCGGHVSVRPCTLSDEAQVMKMSEGIYEGWDYLPACFHRWLNDPDRHMFVAESVTQGEGGEDQLVGLDTVSLFDKGNTVMFQALRVVEAQQGRGVGKLLSATGLEFACTQLSPLPQRVRVTTRWPQNLASVHIHRKLGYTDTVYRPLAVFSLVSGAEFSADSRACLEACQRRGGGPVVAPAAAKSAACRASHQQLCLPVVRVSAAELCELMLKDFRNVIGGGGGAALPSTEADAGGDDASHPAHPAPPPPPLLEQGVLLVDWAAYRSVK
jgi:hypothetical protein